MNSDQQPAPCPFCGATKITVEWEACERLVETDTNRRWFAECTQCSCQGPFCQKEPEVIPAWNKRIADASALTRERDALLREKGEAEAILGWAGGTAAGLVAACHNATAERDALAAKVEQMQLALQDIKFWCEGSARHECGRLKMTDTDCYDYVTKALAATPSPTTRTDAR